MLKYNYVIFANISILLKFVWLIKLNYLIQLKNADDNFDQKV